MRDLDASQSAALAVDGVLPRYACTPASFDEAAEAASHAAAQDLAVVPRGAGSGLGLGFPPAAADLVLETRGLNRVIAYEPADLTVTVEAGLSIGALQRLLHAEGQFLALDPPGPAEATLGGIIATNASGPMRFAHGTARDLVIGTRVVNADGRLTRAGGRVVKNVAGYDLNKLYIGSLGTLGLVVELSFKLTPLPPRHSTVAASFADLDAARRAVLAVLRSPLSPQCVDLLDATAAAGLGLDTPGGGYLVLLRAAGFERAVERQVRDLGAVCEAQDARLLTATEDDAQLWHGVRQLAFVQGDAVLLKSSVPISETAAMHASLNDAAAREGLAPVIFSHAGSGVVYARLEGSLGQDAWLEAAERLVLAARAAASARGGSLIVEAAPTALKQRLDVWGEVGPSFRVMQALKRELDPKRTLNPGRFVGHL